MSGLIGDLKSVSQTLAAQQKALEITGKNLANVSSTTYSRESVNFVSTGPGGTGSMGITATSVVQARSTVLDQLLVQEASQTGSLQAQVDGLTSAQGMLGETVTSSTSPTTATSGGSGTTGITAGLTSFFNAFSSLAASPTDATQKQLLLQQSSTLVNQINGVDSQLQTLQTGITTQATSDVASVNSLLTNIATLNSQIAKNGANAPDTKLTLLDERQADLQQLGSYMNITTQSSASGNDQIQVMSQDSLGNSVMLVNGTTPVTGGISFDGTHLTVGTPTTSLSLQSGLIAGEISVRDGAIQQLRDNVASTASELTSAVNSAYNPTGATGNFFQTSPTTGLIALDPTLTASNLKTTDTTNAGANELALAVTNVATKTFSTGAGDSITGTISGFYGKTVTGLGASLSNSQAALTNQQNVQQMLTTQQSSVGGVSMDEELTNLMQYERAYQASSKIINVLDSLLNTVVNSMVQ